MYIIIIFQILSSFVFSQNIKQQDNIYMPQAYIDYILSRVEGRKIALRRELEKKKIPSDFLDDPKKMRFPLEVAPYALAINNERGSAQDLSLTSQDIVLDLILLNAMDDTNPTLKSKIAQLYLDKFKALHEVRVRPSQNDLLFIVIFSRKITIYEANEYMIKELVGVEKRAKFFYRGFKFDDCLEIVSRQGIIFVNKEDEGDEFIISPKRVFSERNDYSETDLTLNDENIFSVFSYSVPKTALCVQSKMDVNSSLKDAISKIANRQEALKILGLEAGATAEQIREAFKKMSFTRHPDRGIKGGDIIKVNWAYRVLTGKKI